MKAPIAQFGRASAPFNVVPVDFVVDAIAALSRDDAADGETLHLVDPEPADRRRAHAAPRARVRGQGADVPRCRRRRWRSRCGFKPVREMFEGAPRESIAT